MESPEGTAADDEQAQRWLASIDLTAYVGSRHHTVPRFLLERWADGKDQVRVYHRIEERHGLENITNLSIRDFYTVINDDGSCAKDRARHLSAEGADVRDVAHQRNS